MWVWLKHRAQKWKPGKWEGRPPAVQVFSLMPLGPPLPLKSTNNGPLVNKAVRHHKLRGLTVSLAHSHAPDSCICVRYLHLPQNGIPLVLTHGHLSKAPKFMMARSTKFWPTCWLATTSLTPSLLSRLGSPTPETCSSWGVKMAPLARITPFLTPKHSSGVSGYARQGSMAKQQPKRQALILCKIEFRGLPPDNLGTRGWHAVE